MFVVFSSNKFLCNTIAYNMANLHSDEELDDSSYSLTETIDKMFFDEDSSEFDDSDTDKTYKPPVDKPDPLSSEEESGNTAWVRIFCGLACMINASFLYLGTQEERKKLTRKRKRKTGEWKRNVQKLNRTRGKEYVSSSTGKSVAAKKLGNPCLSSCKRKCSDRFTDNCREKIFSDFYNNLNNEEQNQLLAGLIQISPNGPSTSKKKNFMKYFLLDQKPENQVCLTMFLSTFSITHKKVKIIYRKKLRSASAIANGDQRGKHGQQKKISEDACLQIQEHIKSFPAFKSHYTRKDTEKKYLSPSLSISEMYRLYSKDCDQKSIEPEKEHTYRKIFNENFNYSFHPPSKDTCEKCDIFKAALFNATDDEKKVIESKKEQHLLKAELAYEAKRKDKEHATASNDCVTASFDMQKVLPCPLLQTGVVYYKRQLAVYNLTVYESSKQGGNKGHCFMWNETIAGRGSQEIGSCLWKWMDGLPEEIKDIRLYSDSCGGQNRNYPLSAMLMHLSQTKEVKITHTYLLPGHTHMEADSIHGIIEKHKKTTNAMIEIPRDWITTIRSIHRNKKLNVVAMQSKDFKSSKHLFSNRILINRSKNESGVPVGWMKIRRIFYGRKRGQMDYVTSLSPDAEISSYSVLRRETPRAASIDWDFPELHKDPLPIGTKKHKDLLELLPVISEESRQFYLKLKTDGEDRDEEETI